MPARFARLDSEKRIYLGFFKKLDLIELILKPIRSAGKGVIRRALGSCFSGNSCFGWTRQIGIRLLKYLRIKMAGVWIPADRVRHATFFQVDFTLRMLRRFCDSYGAEQDDCRGTMGSGSSSAL